jgi:hypothetical protein
MDASYAWIAVAASGSFISFSLIPTDTPRALKRGLPLASTALALCLPSLIDFPHELLDTFVRICSGYLAMKTLDLCVARADNPPRLLDPPLELPQGLAGRMRYAWLLMQQTRYESFSISVIRPRAAVSLKRFTSYYALLGIAAGLQQGIPCPETTVLLVLASIETVFEIGHLIIRATSSSRLFDRPFLAPTLTDFWTRRWHAIIRSPLTSLAYKPTQRLIQPYVSSKTAKAAGLLAGFTLSGAWHAWAVVPLGGWRLAFRVGMVFVAQAIGSLAEISIWGRKETALRRGSAWIWGLTWASWAVRAWDGRTKYGL